MKTKNKIPEAYLSSSYEETLLFGRSCALSLMAGSVLALCGDLGSGKTAFVRGLCEGLGNADSKEVCSPTFSLLNIYTSTPPLYHFDLYRLPNAAAFFEAGFDEYVHAKGICCIEWADKILPRLPAHTLLLTFSHRGASQRHITISPLVP